MKQSKKKIRIEMSVEFDVLAGERPQYETNEWLYMVAKNYVECLGDKSIKVEEVTLYDNY